MPPPTPAYSKDITLNNTAKEHELMTAQTTHNHRLPIFSSVNPETIETVSAPRSYQHIVVLLDGSGLAERAIPAALELAQTHEASVTVICRSGAAHAHDYAEAKARDLRQQGIEAHGYAADMNANWLVQSEGADVVVLAQGSASRWGRLLGTDLAAALRHNTDADVVAVAV